MNQMLVILLVCCFSVLVTAEKQQSVQCALCRQIFTALISEIGEVVSEDQVDTYLRLGCASLGLDSWCNTNVYPNIHDIFMALRSNKTDDIICERIALCNFKVKNMTGDVLFANIDELFTIKLLTEGRIQPYKFADVDHPALPDGIISGLACSVDYCAVLFSNATHYGTTAISIYQQINQLLPAGYWYGPWFDIITQEFWMATGSSKEYTFGIFDPQFGDWEPKVSVYLPRAPYNSEILSGQILDRVLYFTLLQDPHVYKIDLVLRLYRGNFSTPNNTMIVGNPVTNELYGYSPSTNGIWKFMSTVSGNRTLIVPIDLSTAQAVPSGTINPIDNTLWISLWSTAGDYWFIVDLTKSTDNLSYAQTGDLDGLFDFNPYTIISEEA